MYTHVTTPLSLSLSLPSFLAGAADGSLRPDHAAKARPGAELMIVTAIAQIVVNILLLLLHTRTNSTNNHTKEPEPAPARFMTHGGILRTPPGPGYHYYYDYHHHYYLHAHYYYCVH